MNELDEWLASMGAIGIFGDKDAKETMANALKMAGILARGKSNAKPDPRNAPNPEVYIWTKAKVAKVDNMLMAAKDDNFNYRRIVHSDEAPTENDKHWFIFIEWDIQIGETAYWEIKIRANNNTSNYYAAPVEFDLSAVQDALNGMMFEEFGWKKEEFERRFVEKLTKHRREWAMYDSIEDKDIEHTQKYITATKAANRYLKKAMNFIEKTITEHQDMLNRAKQLQNDATALRNAAITKAGKIFEAVNDLQVNTEPQEKADDDEDDIDDLLSWDFT